MNSYSQYRIISLRVPYSLIMVLFSGKLVDKIPPNFCVFLDLKEERGYRVALVIPLEKALLALEHHLVEMLNPALLICLLSTFQQLMHSSLMAILMPVLLHYSIVDYVNRLMGTGKQYQICVDMRVFLKIRILIAVWSLIKLLLFIG